MTLPSRLLPLEGGHNFRDLGGYETTDGRTLKWGKVYRSGVMSHLTDADFVTMSRLGIRVVCDFRSVRERHFEPTQWRGEPAITYLAWDYATSEGALVDVVGRLKSVDAVRQAMLTLYERLAFEHAEKYRVMFDHLANGEVPLVFNCSAGKDRTGTAAALLLSVLGVPETTIVEDYVFTEQAVSKAQIAARIADAQNKGNDGWAFLAQLPPEMRAPLLAADPAYLNALFAALIARHGSVLEFLEAEVGVDKTKRERLKAQLLD